MVWQNIPFSWGNPSWQVQFQEAISLLFFIAGRTKSSSWKKLCGERDLLTNEAYKLSINLCNGEQMDSGSAFWPFWSQFKSNHNLVFQLACALEIREIISIHFPNHWKKQSTVFLHQSFLCVCLLLLPFIDYLHRSSLIGTKRIRSSSSLIRRLQDDKGQLRRSLMIAGWQRAG